MIKFFRQIRQKLLTENRFNKYLIYAIGEIVLVVIGILIALQINNWNENRKENLSENLALLALRAEFDKNINRLKYICVGRDSAYQERLRYWNLITNKQIPLQTKIQAYPKGYFGGTWAVRNTVLNGLVNSGQIDNIKNDTLKNLLLSWPNRVQFWNNDEAKWIEVKQNLSNYLNSKIRRVPSFTTNGKSWQSNATIFKDEKISQITSFINELEYQNLISNITNQLYIQTIHCDGLLSEYQKIISSLNGEIRKRKIKSE